MDVVVSISKPLSGYLVNPVAQQLSYLVHYRTKFQDLQSKVQELKDARERVQQAVREANRKGEVIFDDVQRWLIEVNEKISNRDTTQLLDDDEGATVGCFAGFCPDFKSRYLLSKKAEKETDAIAQLLNRKEKFDTYSYRPAIEGIRPVKHYEAFGSRSGAFDGVMEALKDDTASIIGVVGMGGVGKTTLVKVVAGQAKKTLPFDEVVFVTVTQTTNTINIQNNIANELGLELNKDASVGNRAAQIYDRLIKVKKVLIILDDIWEEQEVNTLGIPSADQHKGCKILVTSRSLNVLKCMDSHPIISIETLKEDEAWNLFKKIAGHIVERPDLQSTAVEVAKRCAGLPVAIATIAKALKAKENLFEWKDTLRQLSKPSERNFKGMPAKAYSAIELSYKFLEGEELGPIFLLCSILGHDAAVEDLLRYAIGLGLIHDVNTMEEARYRVLTLVSTLKASCLLLEGSRPNYFDMHDVVRDVAQSIASRDRQWLALFKEWPDEKKMKESQLMSLQNAEVSKVLNDEPECPTLNYFSIGLEGSSLNISSNFFKGMQRLKVLEFAQTHFTSLPSSLGSLKTLFTLRLLECNLEDIVILGELEKLEILDLRRSRMKMLPNEIGRLTKLKLLDLSDCYKLQVISPNVLSKLSRLEELYLYHSFYGWEVEGIDNPSRNVSLVELQHLSCLTTLEVHIPDVEAIPKDNLFFGRLKRYKISIGNEKYHEQVETSMILKPGMNKSIHLVGGIKLLFGKTESLHVDGLEDVGEMLYDTNAESFGQLRFIKVKNCNMLENLFSFSIAKRLSQLEELELSNCDNIRGLIVEKEEIDENDFLEFNKLRILKLGELNKFKGSWYSDNTFQSATWLFDKKVSCHTLEELHLNFVSDIEKIWHIDDQLPLMSFGVQSLTTLIVYNCYKLKYAFTSSMSKCFVHLKSLNFSFCDEMEWVIEGILAATEEEKISGSIRMFPKLDTLDLVCLPKLNRFCCGIDPIEFSSLRHLSIYGCHDLKTFSFDIRKSRVALSHSLFNEKVIFPVLEELYIQRMDNLERLWADQLVEHSFSKLTSIYLEHCPKLMNVFPLSMSTRLQRLGKLMITHCESVEEIIYESGPQEGGSSSPQFKQSNVITFEFPSLTSLTLENLPNLKSIHHKMHTINWPSLKKMKVSECDKVEILFASQETSGQHPLFWVNESTFSNLQKVTLGWNAGIKDIIWHYKEQQQQQIVSHCFCNLKVVKLEWYPGELTVLPSYLFRLLSLPNLQRLEIRRSSFKEMIFQSEECGNELCQITELRLQYLKELGHLWKEKEGFPSLKILQVCGCPELKGNLVPSWVSFRNLVTLTVLSCDGIIKLFTHSTAKSLVQLKEMRIANCKNVEEIVQGGDDDDDEISFPQLGSLKLEDLPTLESFCSSGSYTFGFPSLQILVPSSVSFRSLVTLELSNCDGIIKLITHSTAKCLVRLQQMRIGNCENIEEVIQGGDDDDDEISFPKLNSLELEDLPNLESFCSLGNYTFGFPSLQILVVDNCPNMKMFSQGHSNTPMLHKVQINWLEERWEGNLNNTIQKLFREKHAMIDEHEDSEEVQSNPLTTAESGECENSNEDESNPSTSNEDQRNPSTSNTQKTS